ncbi:MAG: AraC family transcriptional regulator [Treponema sp.]|nr:AraC family transcriptional regulator [Treponema sp.]
MDSIVDMLFFPQLFKCGFSEKAKHRNGPMYFSLRRSYGEGTFLVKPVGKSLAVGVSDFCYRQPIEIVWEQPEYFHINFGCGSLRGILGNIVKNDVFRGHYPSGFHNCNVGVSFLPDFFDDLLGQRHGISRDELEQAIDALGRFPPPPDAALVLKQIGEGASSGGTGNAWFEAKTLELISLLLDWHRRLDVTALPQLTEHDRAGITEVLTFVEEHFTEPISLNILAKLAAMSVSKFTVAFKRHTGLSATTYISRFRMEKATNMLKKTSVPIGEIATMVGYKHHASFSAAFQEQFGITPGEFRKGNDKR